MKNSRIAIVGILVSLLALTGCAKREISPDVTNSVKVEGTSWWRFCDGPNAVMWSEGLTSSDDDEIEAYVYDHYACAPDFYGDEQPASTEGPTRGDEDGLLGDEEN